MGWFKTNNSITGRNPAFGIGPSDLVPFSLVLQDREANLHPKGTEGESTPLSCPCADEGDGLSDTLTPSTE